MVSMMLRALVVMTLLLPMLGACDRTTPEQYLEQARVSYGEREYRTAVIQLKNALQQQPDLAAARLLLGQAHLKLGDYPSALKELERAMDLGLSGDDLRAALLQAKNGLGRHAEVIGELEDAGALAPLFAGILGDAYLAAEDVERARVLYLQAVELASGNLGLGTIAWAQGDAPRARSYLRKATELDPFDPQAWLRLAEFELSSGDFRAARAAFESAQALPAGRLSGTLGLARVDLAAGDTAAAAEQVAEVLRLAPQLPVAHYLDGLTKFQQQDIDGAEAAIREVQRTVPNHPPSLYLMGTIKAQQGQLSQARDNLQRFLAVQPDNESAAKLLASVYLQDNDLEAVVEVLTPFAPDTRDAQLLAMLGTTQLRSGDAAAATTNLEAAVELAPDAAAFRNQLALSLLSAGDAEGAESTLRSAIEVDAEQFQSDYLLALLRLRERDFDGAQTHIDALIEKSPDSPLGYNLKGGALMGLGDEAGARAQFERAVGVDPAYVPAAGNLARMDLAADDVAAAMGRYQAVLGAAPGNETALLALAELTLGQGDLAATERFLREAVSANSRSIRPRLGLARLYLADNRPADATAELESALELAPDSVDLLLLAAEADLRSGRTAAARSRAEQLQDLLRNRADDARLAAALGVLQARTGQLTLARRNLEAAIRVDAENVAVLRELARLELREGALDTARARLAELKTLVGDDVKTRLLEGDLKRAAGQAEEAAAIYAALAADGNRDGATRSALLALSTGQLDAAFTQIDGWLEQHPDDLGMRLLRADGLLRQDDNSAALIEYERLVESDNPVVLNNLAWLYMEKGDPRALEMAERAYELAPTSADIADTLGWILVRNGRAAEGVAYLKKSVQLNPRNATVKYHLGIAEREVGNTQAAEAAFRGALELGEFPEREDSMTALSELGAVSP